MPMNAEYRGPTDLPEVIPVFPLPGALLLPRGQMPLNIFEPRYLAMIDDAMRDGHRLIGMIQPDGVHEVPRGKPALFKIGCVGRITQLAESGDGRYIIGNPQGTLTPTLWGLPVVATQAMTIRKFLTGAFKLGAQLFDRWDARVETGFVNDDFIKNLVTVLAEERLALAVYRPEAFIYGDFDTALAA